MQALQNMMQLGLWIVHTYFPSTSSLSTFVLFTMPGDALPDDENGGGKASNESEHGNQGFECYVHIAAGSVFESTEAFFP